MHTRSYLQGDVELWFICCKTHMNHFAGGRLHVYITLILYEIKNCYRTLQLVILDKPHTVLRDTLLTEAVR